MGGGAGDAWLMELQATIFACNPIAGSWDPTIPGLNCRVGVFESHMAANIFNTITDFVILVLPIPMVVQLRADWRKKCTCLLFHHTDQVDTEKELGTKT